LGECFFKEHLPEPKSGLFSIGYRRGVPNMGRSPAKRASFQDRHRSAGPTLFPCRVVHQDIDAAKGALNVSCGSMLVKVVETPAWGQRLAAGTSSAASLKRHRDHPLQRGDHSRKIISRIAGASLRDEEKVRRPIVKRSRLRGGGQGGETSRHRGDQGFNRLVDLFDRPLWPGDIFRDSAWACATTSRG
jgi:hypothetical protein